MRDTEKDILELLYSRYYSSALLYCMALCGSRETAEDLVSDAFIKAYLSLPDEIPSFQYWLLRVCKNLWIDELRKRKRTVNLEAMHVTAEEETPEARYLKTERSRCLWNIIRQLPAADREILTLHYFSGMQLKDISQILGKSYPAVRQRLVRLRQTIKKQMEEQEYGF